MKTYQVRLTPDAETQIFDQFVHIAVTQKEPQKAHDWLDRTEAAAKSLDMMPSRCSIAEENAEKDYEVRKRGIDGFNLLFTVMEERGEVWVFGTRGARMEVASERYPDTLRQIAAELRGAKQAAEDEQKPEQGKGMER